MNATDFITAERAMVILHVSKSTLYKYVREGKIPAFRIHKSKILFKEKDLINLLENSKINPEPKPEPIKIPEEPEVKVKPVTKDDVLNRLKTL